MRADKGRKRIQGDNPDRMTVTFSPPVDGVKDMTDEEFWARCDEYHESRRHSNPNRGTNRQGRIRFKEKE